MQHPVLQVLVADESAHVRAWLANLVALVGRGRLDSLQSPRPWRPALHMLARSRRRLVRVALAFALLVLFGLLAVAPLAAPLPT